MSSWQERESYLIDIAGRCVSGHKWFDLCRSHLVQASQISKGTIYNHFPAETDLLFALAINDYQLKINNLELLYEKHSDPLECYLLHHCWCLMDILKSKKFVVARMLPNDALLALSSDIFRQKFTDIFNQYNQLNYALIDKIGDVNGYNRRELVTAYVRGAIVHSDDENKQFDDIQMYQQLCYAIMQLLGQSHRRVINTQLIEELLANITNSHQQSLNVL